MFLHRLRSCTRIAQVLILLMLAVSSQAGEILVHDGHGHANDHGAEVQSAHSAHGEKTPYRGHDHDAVAAPVNEEGVHEAGVAPDEPCFCKDLCCMTTVEFGEVQSVFGRTPFTAPQVLAVNHYQSVSLDPKRPPPTIQF